MKKSLILLITFFGFSVIIFAQTTIQEARNLPEGTVVTVKGIVTNGSEMNPIKYFQDNTAGIAAYSSTLNSINRGDSVSITGTLKSYNQLLEIDPVSSYSVLSTANPLPEPLVLTPSQIDESSEAELVRVNNVLFSDAGTFVGNKKYQFTSDGETGYIYIKNGQTDIIGQTIPSGLVNLTAICSQFSFDDPNGGYQLLPRKFEDIEMTSSIYLTSILENTNFTQTQLEFYWETNIEGTTEMFYGLTEETVNTNLATGDGGSTEHYLSITGLTAGQVIWVQAFSVSGSDTAFSGIIPFATISNSTGDIKVYFNTAVDTFYSHGVDAITLPNALDDTLISYINRAKYTIDFTMYNFNNTGISNVSSALNTAGTRGVQVRVIVCGTTDHSGTDQLQGENVHVFVGPDEYHRDGIMHNKFIVFDTESENPNDPLVWTGSTNLTDGQINEDANNVIIIQDQSLARTYKIEFEEMWGSSSVIQNAAEARFGFTKKNNTPHNFVIGGKIVECYFSPTDGVNSRIVQNINTANHDLSIATMLITRTEMADAIASRVTASAAVNVITNEEANNSDAVNTILSEALDTHYTFDEVTGGMLHHKYMIVDQDAAASDPFVFTGCHNWSASADSYNDENTVIVHDATIANIYYQNFVKRFVENHGILTELTSPPIAVNDIDTTKLNHTITFAVLENDEVLAPVTVSVEVQAVNGTAFKPISNPNFISYQPNTDFQGNDSITYRIAYQASPDLYALAKIFIHVNNPDGITESETRNNLTVYPNPVKDGKMTVSFVSQVTDLGHFQLLDITGKLISEQQIKLTNGENIMNYNLPVEVRGTYFLRLITTNTIWYQKVIVN
ncbi:MAG: T9SS type A sorting domain-containing protein [Bacteroidales bacterium]|nr:T9SS type A sorting domain-containing protein [Bacteroidales bacterium]